MRMLNCNWPVLLRRLVRGEHNGQGLPSLHAARKRLGTIADTGAEVADLLSE
jgi:hypothetical protein